MRDIFVWLVVLVSSSFTFIYVYQIYKHKIFPNLSMWIIFFCGVGLSFVTYIISEKNDYSSGVLNIIDLVNVFIVISAILIWGKKGIYFKPFDKWYLIAVGLIIIYGILTGDAWNSNILTQILISVGYFPTMHALLKSKINTESFTAWGTSLLASMLALYPSLVGGNILAVVYSVRAISFISILLGIMIYCEFNKRKKLAKYL